MRLSAKPEEWYNDVTPHIHARTHTHTSVCFMLIKRTNSWGRVALRMRRTGFSYAPLMTSKNKLMELRNKQQEMYFFYLSNFIRAHRYASYHLAVHVSSSLTLVLQHHAVKIFEGEDIWIHLFVITSAQVVGQWSVSCPGNCSLYSLVRWRFGHRTEWTLK